MQKMIKRIVSGFLALCLVALLSATTVSATMVAYGSEKAGYLVATYQLRKKSNTFDDSKVNKKYRSYMTYGMKVWNETGVVKLKRSKSSVNKVRAYNLKDTSVAAHAVPRVDFVTGKLIRCDIEFNSVYTDNYRASLNKAIAAHEIGHTFGLLDLYEKRNKPQVMYGGGDSYPAKPTAKDIKGAKYATRK